MPSTTRTSAYHALSNGRFWMELRSIMDRVSFDGAVRVIVLSSALDRFFTAGLDSAFLRLVSAHSSHGDDAQQEGGPADGRCPQGAQTAPPHHRR